MIGLAEARRRAEAHIATFHLDDVIIIDDAIVDTDDAWFFPYNSRAFALHGDISAALAGNVPVRVPKDGGVLSVGLPESSVELIPDRWSTRFELAVERLGQSARVQRKYLQRLRVGVDELALEFDDLFLPDRLSLTNDQEETARQIDRLLGEMNDAPDTGQWSLTGLSDPRWAVVRSIAQSLLLSLRAG
ncbi:YrhB domain-containing protein [Mycobacteroides salmoniphilum]|uniref:Immunity protein 35 domain-containing protein n=1 Tax=Mycobacteroides salmoniphilum TaxID=404941 RepID=A0A4R8SGW3_9MYCO|nr:YrhB domain-containing protein [Mycobacteroides salmoniphilum]TDZ96173.1 hypothetical protein CCUG60885_02316 [Mycobacteroides salmoniphilum]TEA05270.1 hypothetical protein CCUG60883_02575 [Mycobacteroides salmoniphilum]